MRTTLEIPMTPAKDLNVILMVLRPLLAIGIRRRRADGYLASLASSERDNFVWNNNLRANEREQEPKIERVDALAAKVPG